MTKNQVNTTDAAELATPSFLSEYAGMGNENVSREDMIVPRLTLLQGLSPELKPTDPKYLKGAAMGNIVHLLTGEIYPNGVYVVNCMFAKEFAVFKKRTLGGGFRGTFGTMQEAQNFVAMHPESSELEVNEQAVHYCLLLDEDKQYVGEAAIMFASTKLKVSRKWNSLIDMDRGAPRFAKIYKLTSVTDKNAKGEFYNYAVSPSGFITADLAPIAAAFYKAVVGGTKVVSRDDHSETTVEVDEF